MIDARQVIAMEAASPSLGHIEWLRAWLADLSARFGSWQADGDDDDLLSAADPQVVAVMQFIATLLADDQEKPE